MAEWQPIETAPKDGTYVLTGTPKWGVNIERWNGREWTGYSDDGPNEYETAEQPTHWMPVPQLPAQSTSSA